jgi:diguanylate cyclase (GGDEF)-like protein
MIRTDYIYSFAIALLCFCFFVMEYYLTIDFVDAYYRNVCIITIAVPLGIGVLIECVIKSTISTKLLPLTMVSMVFIIMMYTISNIFSKLIAENEERVFAQSRLLEKVNEANETLRLNQEKINKSNELLGIQKLELEVANNKINSVNKEMMIQNEIVKYISSSLEIGKLMTLITESIIKEIGVEVCAIVLYPEMEHDEMQCKVRSTLSTTFSQHLKSSMMKRCFEPYLVENKTYIDNRVKESNYSFIKNAMINSLIIVPLINEEKIIGTLFVGHPKYDYFVDNIVFFEAIVAQFMIALHNANLYSKMRYMAIRDGLTDIYNRRHLTKLYNEALNETIINRSSLSVVLFDIDKFKSINDSYGHLFGDTVIQTIASLSEEIAKDNGGEVGRYGGEEFVILFPDKGVTEVYPIIDELRNRIKETELLHNAESIYVTISVGITSYPETCKNPSELLNRADWAMYYSKQNGRDCITVDKDDIRENVMLK